MSSASFPAAIAPERRTILGVSTQALTSENAADWLEARMARRQTTKVAFLNAHMATMARRDLPFRKVLDDFAVFNDGVGVDLASLFKYGKSYPANLNGTDFIPFYLRRTKSRLRIYLLGAGPTLSRKPPSGWLRTFPSTGSSAPATAIPIATRMSPVSFTRRKPIWFWSLWAIPSRNSGSPITCPPAAP